MNTLLITGLVISITTIILMTLLKVFGRTNLHRMWFMTNLMVFGWGMGCVFIGKSTSPNEAYLWWRIAIASGVFIAPFFYHTICIFAVVKQPMRLTISYIEASLFTLLALFTGITINQIRLLPWSVYYPKGNFLFLLMIICWATVILLGTNVLIGLLKKSTGSKHLQTRYLIIAFLVGFIGGGLTLFPAFNLPYSYILPFGNFGVALYAIIGTYAILRHRLMDVKVAATRAGIFSIVYIVLLGIPLWIGYKFGYWQYSTWIMLFSATLGPVIYNSLRHRAEAIIRAEEYHAHELLKQASEGMTRIHNIRELLGLMVHITSKTLKLNNAAVFLIKENSSDYNLSAVRQRSKYHYLESLNNQDPLIQKLSTFKEPLVYEEVKVKAQELKNKPDDPIHEIESQMRKLQAAVVIPALSKGRLLGFLVLGEKHSKRMYSQEDLSTLWTLSYQAALAIENALFYEKEKMWLAEQSKRQALAEMAPGASHQFDNRLSTICATADNLLDLIKNDSQGFSKEQLIDTVSGELEVIRGEVMKGKQITEAILQKAKVKLEFDEVDIIKVIQNAINMTHLRRSRESLAGAKEPAFVFNYPKDLPKITLCEGPIQDVFENMFNNAIDAIVIKDKRKIEPLPYDGKITINIFKKDNSLIIQIEDNGIGIQEESLHKLFTPLFTTKATSEKGVVGGSGLGLCVMRDFVESHGGIINVESEYTKWARFTVTLPLDFKPR